MKRWGWPIKFKTAREPLMKSIEHENVLKRENVEDHGRRKGGDLKLLTSYISMTSRFSLHL